MMLDQIERMTIVDLPAKDAPVLSLVMILAPYEPAASIARALDSVKGVVDEVVLYWTGKPDDMTLVNLGLVTATWGEPGDTDSPCTFIPMRAYKGMFDVKWTVGEWEDDFSKARNAAIDAATGEWILTLDADEELDAENKHGIVPRLRMGAAIYSLAIRSHIDEGGTMEHYTARLFPNLPQVRYRGFVHEQPVDSAGEIPTALLPHVVIHHYGYTTEAHETTGKQARNQRLLAKQINTEPHQPMWRLYLAQSLKQSGRPLEAADQYRVCMTLCRQYVGTDLIYEQAATELVSVLSEAGLFDYAISEAMLALKHKMIRHPSFWLTLGNAQNQHGLYQDAISSLERCIACRDTHTQQTDAGVLTWKPHTLLIGAKWELGRVAEAHIHYEEAKRLGMPASYQAHCDRMMKDPVAA